MYIEPVRWSVGAEGRVPRFAQRRAILFFCPIRASSANQISIGLPAASAAAMSARCAADILNDRVIQFFDQNDYPHRPDPDRSRHLAGGHRRRRRAAGLSQASTAAA
jgi:hypothetical protein